VPVPAQCPRRDGRHVAVIDGCGLGSTVGPRTTPPARIAAAHQNNTFEANIPGRMIVDSSPADAMSRSISAWTTAMGLGCWKKGCGGLVRGGGKHHAPRAGRETLGHRRSSRGRRDPDQEDGTDPAQCRIKRSGHGQVAGDDLNVRCQHCRLWAAGEDTDRHARVCEEAGNGAPDPAGAPGDEHRRHIRSCHEDLNPGRGRNTG
jgi:hypothetical protein